MADDTNNKEIDLTSPMTEERMRELLEMAAKEMFTVGA